MNKLSKEKLRVLFHLIDGVDYGLAISKCYGVSQGSIGQHLSELMELGLIRKGKRDKAQHYLVNSRKTKRYLDSCAREFGVWETRCKRALMELRK